MDITLRLLLIAGALLTLVSICVAIRGRRIQIEDSLFWMVFSALLVVIALFPGIAYWLSGVLGFQSPSNFVFVTIIAVLLTKEFRNSSKISVLKYRINQLAQEEALEKNLQEREGK